MNPNKLNAIEDCNRKLARQREILRGAETMKKSVNNQAHLDVIDSTIREAERNIVYLVQTLNNLQIKSQESSKDENVYPLSNFTTLDLENSQDNQNAPSVNNDTYGQLENFQRCQRSTPSGLDLIRANTSYTTIKISHMLQQLEFKLSLEKKYKNGIEKMIQLYRSEGDKKSIADATRNWKHSIQKEQLLRQALKRYADVHVNLDDISINEAALPARDLRRPLTGKLILNIHAVRNLERVLSSSKPSEIFVVINLEEKQAGKTKAIRGDRLDESFELEVFKANEVELIVYEKQSDHTVPLAFLWMKIADIAEDLRRKRIEQEIAGSGWISAESISKSREDYLEQQTRLDNLQDFSTSRSHADAAAAAALPYLKTDIISWFSLEPAGEILLKLDFVRTNKKKRDAINRLARQNAIKYRKGEILERYGHQFEQKQFYQIMQCALCNEFIMNAAGYQCRECKYLCHKKCYVKVVTKCISKSVSETGPDEELLNHRIPHRFEPISNIAANWCCHCGYILPIGKKHARKCTECGLTSHAQCSHLIPDFCGMSMQTANQILSEIRNTRELKASAASRRLKESQSKNVTKPLPPLESVTKPVTEQQKPLPPEPLHRLRKQRVGLDDFCFLAVLGKGNFGKVMLAEAKATKKLYAIKVLKKDFILDHDEVESVKSEKRVFLVANKERHPFLINLYACFQTESRIYFVMEYIRGGDLMLHIQRNQFSLRRAQFYAAEVCLALKYFHENGIIYRDLKLDNILLNVDGHVKIADYGLCKEDMWYGNTTSTFCGTPEFMAPEILLEQKYTRAVDWWAFGVLIYQMLLGQSPFRGEDDEEIFEAILSDAPLYPIHMPKDSISILEKLLVRDPEQRLGSGSSDALEVMAHPFFRNINWDDIANKRIAPPFLPTLKGDTDISNFDSEFTQERPELTPLDSILTDTMQDQFRGFSCFCGDAE